MAKRQDTGSNASRENQRPASHDEDAVPEMTDDLRGRSDEDEGDEFEEDEEEGIDEEEEGDEGSL